MISKECIQASAILLFFVACILIGSKIVGVGL